MEQRRIMKSSTAYFGPFCAASFLLASAVWPATAAVQIVGTFGAWSLSSDTSFVDETSIWSLATSISDASLTMRCDPQLDEINLVLSAPPLTKAVIGRRRADARVTGSTKQPFQGASGDGVIMWTDNDPEFAADFRSLLALLGVGQGEIGFKVDPVHEWVFPLDGFAEGWASLAENCPTAKRIH